MKALITILLVATGCHAHCTYAYDCESYSAHASSRWHSEKNREYLECASSEVFGPFFSAGRAQGYAMRLNAAGMCFGPGAYVVPNDERRKYWNANEWLVFCPQ